MEPRTAEVVRLGTAEACNEPSTLECGWITEQPCLAHTQDHKSLGMKWLLKFLENQLENHKDAEKKQGDTKQPQRKTGVIDWLN